MTSTEEKYRRMENSRQHDGTKNYARIYMRYCPREDKATWWWGEQGRGHCMTPGCGAEAKFIRKPSGPRKKKE